MLKTDLTFETSREIKELSELGHMVMSLKFDIFEYTLSGSKILKAQIDNDFEGKWKKLATELSRSSYVEMIIN